MNDSLYVDGGVAGPNPSRVGGAWAYRLVRGGVVVAEQSGAVTPQGLGVEAVTNNHTELFAALCALADMPDGWRGVLWTDSDVTRVRLLGGGTHKGLPAWMCDELKHARRRFPHLTPCLLAGHPSRKDLAAGHKRSRRGSLIPVSPHNVACDRLCRVHTARLLDAARTAKFQSRPPTDGAP